MSAALQFVDCSSNNAMPNVAAYARAGHKHLCRKVSEGVGYHWADGDRLTAECHQVGVNVGHYHWLRPDSSPTAQAAYFVGLLKGHLKAGDWLMADFERTADAGDPADVTRAAQLHEFVTHVAAALPGYPLYVYTGNWYLDGNPHMQAECRRWPIVMSDYSGAETLPNPYGLNYVAWQWTDRATVAGFSGPVDYNRWLIAPEEEFVMDAEVKARMDTIDQKLDRVLSRFVGTDGVSHTVENTVAHVAKKRPYKSRKGTKY